MLKPLASVGEPAGIGHELLGQWFSTRVILPQDTGLCLGTSVVVTLGVLLHSVDGGRALLSIPQCPGQPHREQLGPESQQCQVGEILLQSLFPLRLDMIILKRK